MIFKSKLFNPENHKSNTEILTDSLAIGFFAGLSVLGNTIPTYDALFIIFKAFGLAAVAQYIYEKKIKKAE